uniref:Uncharacterized protein n=5 Tax=Micrurus spixii TaxID=129469 RepID=A0A2D4MN64_9SAUR
MHYPDQPYFKIKNRRFLSMPIDFTLWKVIVCLASYIFPAKLLAEKYDTDKTESSFLYYNPPARFQRGQIHFSSFTAKPGGRDCFSFSAFSLSVITKVYRYRLQRTLNFTLSLFFLILTDFASFLLAVSRKSLISSIFRGMARASWPQLP